MKEYYPPQCTILTVNYRTVVCASGEPQNYNETDYEF